MNVIAFPDDELQALHDVFTSAERVSWVHYDRARARILAHAQAQLVEHHHAVTSEAQP